MSLGTILLIVLILLLLGALPTWPHSKNWGYYPSSGLGLVLIILVVLLLTHRIKPKPLTTSSMAHIVLALFLLVFGLNLLFGLSIPMWVTGLLAVIAGVLLIMERFGVRVDRK